MDYTKRGVKQTQGAHLGREDLEVCDEARLRTRVANTDENRQLVPSTDRALTLARRPLSLTQARVFPSPAPAGTRS
jgi:hypothetical protein